MAIDKYALSSWLSDDQLIQAGRPLHGLPAGEGATTSTLHVLAWDSLPNAPPLKHDDWGPGPWQEEADCAWYKEGEAYGLVLRNPSLGTLNGYVGVPPGHRLHGLDYEANVPPGQPWLNAPGGLSFSGSLEATLKGADQLEAALDYWWFGFDSNHAGDLIPSVNAIHGSVGRPHGVGEPDVYRDLRWTLHYVELMRRRVCIPDELVSNVAYNAFRYIGEGYDVDPHSLRGDIRDLDNGGRSLNVHVSRDDVAECITWYYAEGEPGVKHGRKYDCVGVFKMHSGQLMLFNAVTGSNWQEGVGGGFLSRDPAKIEQRLAEGLATGSRWIPEEPRPLELVADAFGYWLHKTAPTTADFDRAADALAEAENAFADEIVTAPDD